jgi:hypothetical protein
MDRKSSKLTKDIKKLKDFLLDHKTTLSKSQESVFDTPFFQNSTDVHEADIFKSNRTYSEEGKKFINKLPIKFKCFWYIINNSDVEIQIKGLTIFKLVDIIKRSKNYNNMIDVGTYYMGMGHVAVLTMDKKSKTFFYRHDGGSNGYDREYHYNIYETFVPGIQCPEKLMTFMEALEVLVSDYELPMDVVYHP